LGYEIITYDSPSACGGVVQLLMLRNLQSLNSIGFGNPTYTRWQIARICKSAFQSRLAVK